MGAWEELDTEISADVDLSDLENIANLDDEYGIFEPVQKIAEEMKEQMENGIKRGISELAKKNRSFQEKWINKNCKNPSGVLASSIGYQGDDYSIVVGTCLSHIYPMSIEYGHREIVPIRAKALAFYADSGELIFRKRVRATDPSDAKDSGPFVAPAYDDTEEIAEDIMIYEIAHAGIDWS